MLLKENDIIGGYTVKYLIKASEYASNYRVTNRVGESFFLKLFDMSKIPATAVTDGIPDEITGISRLNHPNIIKFIGKDSYTDSDGNAYQLLITEFLSGMLLSEMVSNGKLLAINEALPYYAAILQGLDYMHTTHELNHNDITPRNILLSKDGNGKVVPKIIDLGHIGESAMGCPKFTVSDLNLLYCAPETLSGMFKHTSDIFSATAVLYYMLKGVAPWNVDCSNAGSFQQKKGLVREARKKELDLSGIPDEYKEIFKYGLALNADDRVNVKDLLGMIASPGSYKGKGSTNTNSNASSHTSANTNAGASSTAQSDSQRDSGSAQQDGGVEIKRNTGGGGGFKDVAGMDKLKQELTNRVIWIIKDKEKAEKYRITPPNGMLLYGPPGCGKTFFAEKFAEESGFNYMLVNGSDLGSTYIHGTQGKIAELFKKAKANAPIIVCFDEFDSFVPSRQSRSAEHRAEEINEFLAQLNNCSKHGIFVIGTTNLKEMIDPAILRKGRLDLQYEIPAPDLTTRHAMFKIHLKGRPLSEDISIDELAQKTEGYASSDIAFIVNEAAMMAALADRKIEHQDIINSINCNPSSLKTNARAKVGYK